MPHRKTITVNLVPTQERGLYTLPMIGLASFLKHMCTCLVILLELDCPSTNTASLASDLRS